MVKSESFSYIEETLNKADILMEKIIVQNEQWPGGGAFEEDIVKTRLLLKDAQTGLIEVSDVVANRLYNSVDINPESTNNLFDLAYHILNLMYHDTKQIRTSLEKGESQTTALKDLDAHLKKFIKHFQETRNYLLSFKKAENL